MIDPNALVFAFGAISTAAVGLVFAFKYWLGDRQSYDWDWALAFLLFAAAIALAALQYDGRAIWPGLAANILFWSFAAKMVQGNLAFSGQASLRLPLLTLCALLAVTSLGLGFYRVSNGLLLFTTVSAAICLWTGILFRNLPRVGTLIFLAFTLRAITVLFRPYFADSPHLFLFSIASFSANFAVGATLMAGSLMRSRDALLASQQGLHEANTELTAREAELKESNHLLEEHAVRLERLGADYANALRRAEKANRAKDTFISNMNHEFRTPLNAILGFTELIGVLAAQKGDAQVREYAQYAHEGGQAMLRNVNRILDFVAIDSGAREVHCLPFDPRQAIRAEIGALVETAQAKRLEIAELLDAAPPAWRGDERAFRTVVEELLRNAVKAAPEASTVTIRIANETNELSLQIEDLGGGISEDFLATIGETFNISQHVLDRGGDMQGVGLGLCIAARYARLMNGALSFGRNQPRGTVARVVLSAAA